jgi:transforming growth factor-beta-induced protein
MHLLPNVICSAVIQGQVKSKNVLDRMVNLTRDENEKMFIEGTQIVSADIMATNGVMHLIDDVIVPQEGGYIT